MAAALIKFHQGLNQAHMFPANQVIQLLQQRRERHQATELQARGHELIWASGKAVKPLLNREQINLHELSETGWRWPPSTPTPESRSIP